MFFETHTSDPFSKARIGERSGSKTSAEIVDYAFVSACWGQLATRPPAFAIISGWTNCASVRDLRFWSFRFVFVAWRLSTNYNVFLQRENYKGSQCSWKFENHCSIIWETLTLMFWATQFSNSVPHDLPKCVTPHLLETFLKLYFICVNVW